MPRNWLWRCLRLAFALWLAFAILRIMKRPFVLILGVCLALLMVGVAVEALQR